MGLLCRERQAHSDYRCHQWHWLGGARSARRTRREPRLAPFLLSKLLLQRLKESAPARIITTASQAHQGAHIPFDDLNAERSYRGFGRYCETKLANILFTSQLARRLDGTAGTPNTFHPGLV